MSEEYEAALAKWKNEGGVRPHTRPDGFPTRSDTNWYSPAEAAIRNAMLEVEKAGASRSLTEAVTLLIKAGDCVADHVEGIE